MISRASLTIATAALATAGLVALTTTSSLADDPSGSRVTSGPALPLSTSSSTTYAAGLIVTTTSGSLSTALVSATDKLTSTTVTAGRPTVGGRQTLAFATPQSIAETRRIATEIARRPDVVSVEPNTILHAQTASPVKPNDPYFAKQYNVWDARASWDSTPLPAGGGYSIKAPDLWRATKGSPSYRVAVLDTGYTDNTDLTGQLVSGYDFVTAGDGIVDHDSTPTTRDSDAHDPGDYTANPCSATAYTCSSWHGTFTTGQIVAKYSNKYGVAGIAPSSKVQPVRVLGSGGGSTSDIADAIVWAAGGTVSGVAKNPHPSKVISLSLGASGTCESTYQAAINQAHALGAVVVAAAGNESDEDSLSAVGEPANCANVIGVTSTTEWGDLAPYSSVGSAADPTNYGVDISAPGGSGYSETSSGAAEPQVYGLGNTGTTAPGTGKVTQEQGTSMAAPQVSAAAALLFSLGYTQAGVETALKHAVQAYPQYTGDPYNCPNPGTVSYFSCGRGILDLSKVPAPYSTLTISGTMKKGKTVKVVKHWTGTGVTFHYQWYRNGKAISKATKSSYKLTSSDRKKKITVKVTGSKTYFKTLSKTSTPRKVS